MKRWMTDDPPPHDRRCAHHRRHRIFRPTHPPDFLYPAIEKAERDRVLKANASWLAPNHYVPEMDRLIVTIQLWVLKVGGNVIVIDTGVRKPQSRARLSAWTG